MEFLELARNRYSERSFAAKPVEEEKLYKILEAGRIAPTGHNNQPQRVLGQVHPVRTECDGMERVVVC